MSVQSKACPLRMPDLIPDCLSKGYLLGYRNRSSAFVVQLPSQILEQLEHHWHKQNSYVFLGSRPSASAANRVFLDCRGADIRIRRACRTRPVAPHGKADRGSRRRGEREPRPGSPDAAGTRGCLLDGRLPTGCLETGDDPGQAEGCQPGIIQRARLRQAVRSPERRGGARQCVPGRRAAARCGFLACPRPATPSHW